MPLTIFQTNARLCHCHLQAINDLPFSKILGEASSNYFEVIILFYLKGRLQMD
jgi:hypothetical protein